MFEKPTWNLANMIKLLVAATCIEVQATWLKHFVLFSSHRLPPESSAMQLYLSLDQTRKPASSCHTCKNAEAAKMIK